MPNPWAKAHLKWVKGSSSSWMGKPWTLEKKEKVEETWPSLCEKNPQGAQKEIGLGYRRATRTREGILGKCRKQSSGSWMAQGSMLMGTRNKERYVPSAACNSEEKTLEIADNLGTNTYKGKPSTSRRAARWTMKEGGWRSFSLIGGNLPI